MTDNDEIILADLDDEELVEQMHDDLDRMNMQIRKGKHAVPMKTCKFQRGNAPFCSKPTNP